MRTRQWWTSSSTASAASVALAPAGEPNRWRVEVGDRSFDVTTPEFEFYRRRLRLDIDGSRERFLLTYEGNFIRAAHCGTQRTFEIYEPREWELAHHMPPPQTDGDSDELVCPMPGLIVRVAVSEGERVYAGQVLLTLESMKMESGVPAPRDGVIAAVHVEGGQAVDAGDALVTFAQADAD